ncbi:MAG: hypothetical protein ACKV2T_42780 [Kofleriaceae bacterium]
MSPFDRWARARIADGVMLTHPDGVAHGRIRIHHRTNLPTLKTLLGEAAHVGVPIDIAVRPITTHEGEYAVIVVLAYAHTGAVPYERHVALVAGEDAAIQLEGIATVNSRLFARSFEELVHRARTGAAANRRRMYIYRPPPGWIGVRCTLSTRWLAPGYPRDRGSIEVHDAIPIHSRRLEPDRDAESCTPITIGRLQGVWGATGAALSDTRFRYEIEVDDPRGEHRLIFGTLLRSIEPVPVPTPSSVPTTDFGWAQ